MHVCVCVCVCVCVECVCARVHACELLYNVYTHNIIYFVLLYLLAGVFAYTHVMVSSVFHRLGELESENFKT